jgi:hypothetical protein
LRFWLGAATRERKLTAVLGSENSGIGPKGNYGY